MLVLNRIREESNTAVYTITYDTGGQAWAYSLQFCNLLPEWVSKQAIYGINRYGSSTTCIEEIHTHTKETFWKTRNGKRIKCFFIQTRTWYGKKVEKVAIIELGV